MLVELDSMKRVIRANIFPWKKGKPFVENSKGQLVHRLRGGATYQNLRKAHIGVDFWCGMATASSGDNLTFLDTPPEGKILCARCEEVAVSRGLPSADTITGHHVHIGGVQAVRACCNEGEE